MRLGASPHIQEHAAERLAERDAAVTIRVESEDGNGAITEETVELHCSYRPHASMSIAGFATGTPKSVVTNKQLKALTSSLPTSLRNATYEAIAREYGTLDKRCLWTARVAPTGAPVHRMLLLLQRLRAAVHCLYGACRRRPRRCRRAAGHLRETTPLGYAQPLKRGHPYIYILPSACQLTLCCASAWWATDSLHSACQPQVELSRFPTGPLCVDLRHALPAIHILPSACQLTLCCASAWWATDSLHSACQPRHHGHCGGDGNSCSAAGLLSFMFYRYLYTIGPYRYALRLIRQWQCPPMVWCWASCAGRAVGEWGHCQALSPPQQYDLSSKLEALR